MRYALLLSLVGALACGERAEPGRDSERAATVLDDSIRSAAPVVLFLGTSLTAGLGLNQSEAYPALIQQKIDSAG
ncbi:MAG: arylesterase, partial [Gemmatimonadetes bacterium]|nr:arylesterase [Gemmatimonadota bacterium]